jgi:hypothetical protein
MPAIHFKHPRVRHDLVVDVGIDDCSWGYSLNTQTYPTYGGEVVQILSVYIDDLQLGGTVKSYEKVEQIYGWFLDYMEAATQGDSGRGSYSQEPVHITYPYRNWSWYAFPESLPGFRYGREVVAPTWRLTCKVWEADNTVQELTLAAAREGLERVPLGIGFDATNPFSDPMGAKGTKKSDLEKWYTTAADNFARLIPSYMEGDYDSLLGQYGSKPAFLKASAGEQEKGDQVKGK